MSCLNKTVLQHMEPACCMDSHNVQQVFISKLRPLPQQARAVEPPLFHGKDPCSSCQGSIMLSRSLHLGLWTRKRCLHVLLLVQYVGIVFLYYEI